MFGRIGISQSSVPFLLVPTHKLTAVDHLSHNDGSSRHTYQVGSRSGEYNTLIFALNELSYSLLVVIGSIPIGADPMVEWSFVSILACTMLL